MPSCRGRGPCCAANAAQRITLQTGVSSTAKRFACLCTGCFLLRRQEWLSITSTQMDLTTAGGTCESVRSSKTTTTRGVIRRGISTAKPACDLWQSIRAGLVVSGVGAGIFPRDLTRRLKPLAGLRVSGLSCMASLHIQKRETAGRSVPSLRVAGRQGALADGLHGLNPTNTTGTRYTLRDRGSLSERDCRKLGPSGESNAQPIESLPPGALGGVLMVFRAARTGSVQKRSRRLCLDTVASHWPVWRDTFKASPGEA